MEGYKSREGMSGRPDKHADGDGEAARRGLTNQMEGRKEKTKACVGLCKTSHLTDLHRHLDAAVVNTFLFITTHFDS